MEVNLAAKEYQKLMKRVVQEEGNRSNLIGGKRKMSKRKMSKKKSKRAGGVTGGKRKMSMRKISKRKMSKKKSKRAGGVTGGKRKMSKNKKRKMSKRAGGVTGGLQRYNRGMKRSEKQMLVSHMLADAFEGQRSKVAGRGVLGLMTGGCCNCMGKPCPMAKACKGGASNNKLEKMLINKHKNKPKNLKRYREILEDVKAAKKYKPGCSTSPSIQQIRKIASEINKKI